MKRLRFWLGLIWLSVSMTSATHAIDLYLNATAATERGSHLGRGAYGVVKGSGERQGLTAPSTRGWSSEPVAMYLLLSYVAAPTPYLLNMPPVQAGSFSGNLENQLIEERGEWSASARTTLNHAESVTLPAGSFSEVLKYKTEITGARSDAAEGAAFVNGTRYLWFAKGVGLVRMRYEHANGKVTEAVLLSHSVAGEAPGYLPLQVGNRWTYAWKNAYRDEAVIETWRVAERPQSLDGVPARAGSDGAPRIETIDPNSFTLALSEDTRVKVPGNPEKGFHFPYYLFVPKGIDPGADRPLFVEPNNTGSTSDDPQVHEDAAARLIRSSHATRMATELGTALLVPTFPRPADQWQAYTHSLDEDTLLIPSGPLKRIDLQLIQMIRDAQTLLRRNHIGMHEKVFMHGYSASGVFANRFSALHPQIVRAVAAGGINAIPLLPTTQWQGTRLPFPVGIADLQKVAAIEFDETAYKQVSQYLYMGYLDRNDTTLSRDAFSEEHARLIRELIGAEMPQRWRVSQAIYRDLGVPAQCVTYNGSGHEIKSEMIGDLVKFFRANSDSGFVRIQPHEYPFVEFTEIKTAHVNGLYWQGDERLPEGVRNLLGGQNHFIISIQEWMTGQDHQQLNAFDDKAVFRFLLKAPGRADIQIAENHFRGTCSSGHGQFQGFVVGLPASELEKIVAGVGYTLLPIDQRGEYVWEVNAGVQLVRP